MDSIHRINNSCKNVLFDNLNNLKVAKTYNKILDETLKQLNEMGLSTVTQRTVSDSLKISLGNLTYHFKKKEDIINALYYDFTEKMDAQFSGVKVSASFPELIEMVDSLLEVVFKHRFFYMDNLDLVRSSKTRLKHYQAIVKNRKAKLTKMVKNQVKDGYLKKESYNGEHAQMITQLQVIFSGFYSYDAVMQTLNKKVIARHKKALYCALLPYVTAKGKKYLTPITNS